jgi:hypothetical protein
MPGPEEPVPFMQEATRGLQEIGNASMERRWEKAHAETDKSLFILSHDDFANFQTTEKDKYAEWRKTDQDQLAKLQTPAVANVGDTRKVAAAVIKKNLERKSPPLSENALNKSETLLKFGSKGAQALLEAEADTRSKLAAGSTGTLRKEDLDLIDSVRATVQRKCWESDKSSGEWTNIDKHLEDLARAMRLEVCKQCNENFGDAQTWKDSQIEGAFTTAEDALRTFFIAIWRADIRLSVSRSDPQGLDGAAQAADGVHSALSGLLAGAEGVVKAVGKKKTTGEKADTPVTNSGLELHLTLIAQAVGQALASRIVPSYVAAYRLVSERPVPAAGVPEDLLRKMTPDNVAQIWAEAAAQGFGALESVSTSNPSRRAGTAPTPSVSDMMREAVIPAKKQVESVQKQLKEWPDAHKKTIAEGPASIHRKAQNITYELSSIDRTLAGGGWQNAIMTRMHRAIDAVFAKLRADTYSAVVDDATTS